MGLWAAGVAWGCCISQPTCWGYARLQRIRNWAADGKLTRWGLFWCCGGWFFASLELCLRRPALLFVTIVPIVLVSTLSWQLGAGAAPLFFFLFFGGLLIVFRDEARARYEKFCERRPWFRRHVAPRVEKLSAGVAALFGRHVAPRLEKLSAGVASLKNKQAVVALLEKLSAGVASLRKKRAVAAPLADKGPKKGTARLGRCLYCGCCGRCGCCGCGCGCGGGCG